MLKWTVLLFAGSMLAGCGGGGGGGMSLSGGSIPTGGGGGTVTGNLALPSGQPLTSATASAITLSNNQTATVNASIANTGQFTITGVPVSQDLLITFVNGTTTLEAVVPGTSISSSTPVDIGQVNASTTVTAQAIQTEVAAGIDNESTIVATQLAAASTNQANSGESQSQQNDDINNSGSRKQSANTLITKTANTQIANLGGHAGSTTAGSAALDGVLAYAVASGGTAPAFSSSQRAQLINAQTGGKTYTDLQIVTALTAAGATVSVTDVDQATQTQLKNLSALSGFRGIPPLEAIAIAACPVSAGGFGLTAHQQATFVSALTGA